MPFVGLAELLFPKDRVKLDSITLDCTLTENYKTVSDVTEHPVETGVKITDHVRRRPLELTIDGIVSNSPVALLPSRIVLAAPFGRRAQLAYFELLEIQKKGEPIKVSTSLNEYPNMVITSIDLPRDASSANVVRLKISLREIFQANSLQINLVKIPNPKKANVIPAALIGKQVAKSVAAPIVAKGTAAVSTSVAGAVLKAFVK